MALISWNKRTWQIITTFMGSGLTGGVVAYKTFFQDIFTEAFTEWTFDSLFLAIGFICFFAALGKIAFDIWSGGRWTWREKKTAMIAMGIATGAFTASFFVNDLFTNVLGTTPYAEFQIKNDYSCDYYHGSGVDNWTGTYTDPNYFTIPGSDNAQDYATMRIIFNQSGLTEAKLASYRGFNITVDDDGISRVMLWHYDADTTTSTELLDTDDDSEITVFDLGTTTLINATWDKEMAITISSYGYDNINDYYMLKYYWTHGGDYDDTASVTLTWDWISFNTEDIENFSVYTLLCVSGYLPLFVMLNVGKRFRYKKKYRGRRRRRKYYPRRRSYSRQRYYRPRYRRSRYGYRRRYY